MFLTAEDLEVVKRVEEETGIVIFKGPEYDPVRYSMVHVIGDAFFLKSDPRREIQRVRDVVRDFRGPKWSAGLPIGVTKQYQKKYGESADQDQRVYLGDIMDISPGEAQALKTYAKNEIPWTKAERDARTKEREDLRKRAAEDSLTPNAALAETIGKAIAKATGAEVPPDQPIKRKPGRPPRAATEEVLLP
jgi:hypothetical protein